MKRMSREWPLVLACLCGAGILCLAAAMWAHGRTETVFMLIGFVSAISLPIVGLFGLVRSVFCLASRDCRRKTGLRVPIATIFIAVIGNCGIMIMVVALATRLTGEAQVARTRMDLAELDVALTAYGLDCSAPPTAAQGLTALITNPGTARWAGPYLDVLPSDPWGTPFQYDTDASGKPIVTSAGPDLEFGTPDDLTQHTD